MIYSIILLLHFLFVADGMVSQLDIEATASDALRLVWNSADCATSYFVEFNWVINDTDYSQNRVVNDTDYMMDQLKEGIYVISVAPINHLGVILAAVTGNFSLQGNT